MKKLLKKLNVLITGVGAAPHSAKHLTERDLIRMESQIGSQLFGQVIPGHRREFFCLDEHTWIWYEEWTDAQTKAKHSITTRYEIHDNGILKVQDGHPYKSVEGEELRNLVSAIQLYYDQVVRGIYRHDPRTGKPLSA